MPNFYCETVAYLLEDSIPYTNRVISDQLINYGRQVGIVVVDTVIESLLGIHQHPIRPACWQASYNQF
jgi:hypothetical protein